jgi:hypothetical protein
MINNIGDIVQNKKGYSFLITDIKRPNNAYLFQMYSLSDGSTQDWFEPWDQELATSYWDTLA